MMATLYPSGLKPRAARRADAVFARFHATVFDFACVLNEAREDPPAAAGRRRWLDEPNDEEDDDEEKGRRSSDEATGAEGRLDAPKEQ